VGDVVRVAGFNNEAPMFNFVRCKNMAVSIDSDKTHEAELHTTGWTCTKPCTRQLLCGLLVHRTEVLRVGAVFALAFLRVGTMFPLGFLRTIHFMEKHCPCLCRDIWTSTHDTEITDRVMHATMERVLMANLGLADMVEAECAQASWQGIIQRVWPNTKYIDIIVTGAMA
jgi:hypothetical protein